MTETAEIQKYLAAGGVIQRKPPQLSRGWNFDEVGGTYENGGFVACIERITVGDTTEEKTPLVDPFTLERPPSEEEPAE